MLTIFHLVESNPVQKKELTDQQKAHNQELARQHIGYEYVIGKLKIFRILKKQYRNRRKRFGLRLNLITALHNNPLLSTDF